MVRNLNSHGIISAFAKNIHRTRAGVKTLNPQLRDALWQVGTIKQNPAAGPQNGNSQARLNQQKYCPRRPGLGGASDGIKRGAFAATTIESADQFRKTAKIRT